MATRSETDWRGFVDEGARRWTPRVLAILLTYGLWFGIADVFPNNLVPYPIETLQITLELYASGAALDHLLPTLSRIAVAFVLAMVLGIAIGIAMGSTDFGEKYFAPFLVIGLALPSVALAAITRLVFGYTFVAPVVAATIAVVPFVTINVWKGVENIDQGLLEMGSSFNLANARLLQRIVIPNTAPSLFAAIRFGLALSWKVVTVVEVFAASSGIGYKVSQAYQSFQFEQSFAWAVVFIVVVVFIEYLVLKPLERRMFEYRPDAEMELVSAR